MSMPVTKEQIKHMVERFLGWRLPETFNPDGGIGFKKTFNDHMPAPMKHEPTGTNLFDFEQATAMVSYMAEGLPESDRFAWLIEAPGARYLAVRRLTSMSDFIWTGDHSVALRFSSHAQATDTMMALRDMDRSLFGFDMTLGPAKANEHGWM